MLLQVAWTFAVPAFRGIDEFDHAYLADSVAHGNWSPSAEPTENGRGYIVEVRSSIVKAASRMCEFYEYTGPDNCQPVAHLSDGRVTVASAAAGYHPAFYWIIGKPALLAEGSAAILVMRAVSALLCSAMLTLSAHLLALWARSSWPLILMLTTLTPVLIYSTSLAAPNGLEMVSGVATWAGLLGLAQPTESVIAQRRLLAWTMVPAVVLATLRQLGPLWLGLIIVTCLILAGRRQVLQVVREHTRLAGAAVVVVTAAAGASAAWVLTAGSLGDLRLQYSTEIGGTYEPPSIVIDTLSRMPVWALQGIAAFPTRGEQAPSVVYAIYGLIGLVAVVLGFWFGPRRLRLVLALSMFVTVMAPFLLTVATVETAGPIWQGRYTLPYAVGVLMLCGVALDSRPPDHRLTGPALLGTWLAVVVAHATSVGAVFVTELDRRVSLAQPLWPVVPTPVLVCLVLLGCLVWASAVADSGEWARSRPLQR